MRRSQTYVWRSERESSADYARNASNAYACIHECSTCGENGMVQCGTSMNNGHEEAHAAQDSGVRGLHGVRGSRGSRVFQLPPVVLDGENHMEYTLDTHVGLHAGDSAAC